MDGDGLSDENTSREAESEVILAAIDAAIKGMQQQLKSDTTAKVSLTDLVRLLQLRKEMEGDRPRRVSARWVDGC
jgi:hypothetical protein